MKRLILIVLALSFFVACKEKPKNPVSEFGDTMIDSYQKGKTAGKTGNLYAVRQAIQAYHAANGKYPQNLEELEALIGSDLDASMFDYDPQTGIVNLKNK
ncbi:MAG: hypothetical protein AB1632_06110 [Nitrospirota bacterium]